MEQIVKYRIEKQKETSPEDDCNQEFRIYRDIRK